MAEDVSPTEADLMDEDFPGFQEEDDFIQVSQRKKRKMQVNSHYSPKGSNSKATTVKGKNNEQAQRHEELEAETKCLIIRQDKKQIPHNFINNAKKEWEALQLLEADSFERNGRGTIIKATLLPDKVNQFENANKIFTLKSITFEAYLPRIRSQHTAELYLSLEDAEDDSILGYSEAELLKLLKASGDNSVTSVTRIYPKNFVREADYHKYNGMKLCIEFENFTPSRVYFQNVSLPIKDYIMPAKRCFTCQMRGHLM